MLHLFAPGYGVVRPALARWVCIILGDIALLSCVVSGMHRMIGIHVKKLK